MLKLKQGDCIELMAEMPIESVDLVFADPPFNIGVEYPDYNDNLSSQEYIAWSRKWIGEVWNVLKPGGAFWFACGDDYVADLVNIAKRQYDMVQINWVIWKYEFGTHKKFRFSGGHTHLLYFWKRGKERKFTPPKIPSARQHLGDPRACEFGKVPGDVWEYPRITGNHADRVDYVVQMPVEILVRLLVTTTERGDLVLDPFNGSGTTAVAATTLHRKYIGFDISEKSIDVTRERLRWHGKHLTSP